MNVDERSVTAYHEAAHAVACWLLRGSIVGPLSIAPTKHWDGIAHVRARRPPEIEIVEDTGGLPSIAWRPRVRQSIEHAAVIFLAGAAGERFAPRTRIIEGYVPKETPHVQEEKRRALELVAPLTSTDAKLLALGDDPDLSLPNDLQGAYTAAGHLTGDTTGGRLDAYIWHLQHETEALVESWAFQRLLRPLAEALLVHTTISKVAVRRLLATEGAT